jgi:hypothetical protein
MKRTEAYELINTIKRLRNDLTDKMALSYMAIYSKWEAGNSLKVGDRVKYDGKLYKVAQAHTAQEGWEPPMVAALFEPIDVINEGTLENPIVAVSGMAYFKDKYYLDETDGNIYLCTRQDTDDGTVLHFMPNALVGVYF